METDVRPSPASQAKSWIVTTAVVLMAAPFNVLGMRPTSALPAKPGQTGMVWIPGGEFTMGTDKADEKHAEEAPAHAVALKGFWMDVTEVTNTQFKRFADATGYVTDAEKDLDPREFPKAPPEFLKGGSLIFQRVSGVNPFQCGGADLPWWKFTAGANWRHPD